jgi:hypothetical protein
MTKAVLLVWSEPSSLDREDEYNEWYDSTHAPDVLQHVKGITSVRRFKVAPAQLGAVEVPGRFLAIYEVEVDDLAEMPGNFIQAHLDGLIPTTDVIAPGPLVFLEQLPGS